MSRRSLRLKIISGGQTGADRAALDVALKLKILCGGWCPADRRAEDGIIAHRYPLMALKGAGYRQRTRQNVMDSDGTVVFSFGSLTGGSKATAGDCRRFNKRQFGISGGLKRRPRRPYNFCYRPRFQKLCGKEAAVDIVTLFYHLDKFSVEFQPQVMPPLLGDGKVHRDRAGQMCLSEIMTLQVLFHGSNYRTFKHFYLKHVCVHLRSEFPRLLSYNRFVEQIPRTFSALTLFLQTRMGFCSGISFIDSTPLRVCHNQRINSHKVMAGLAGRGKTSTGWFYGFKLHLVINDQGELLNLCFTPGNVDDRKPVPKLSQQLFGKLVGDKGYISQDLFEQLFGRNLQLITRIKSNMKNRLILLWDKLLLRKRALVETVIDQLKNISQIEHSRHRSVINYFTEIVAGLIAYTYRDKLPSLNLRNEDFTAANGIAI